MSKSKRLEVGSLIGKIRYQLAHGVHTWSKCSRKCGQNARGGRTCYDCLVAELSSIVGTDKANLFIGVQREMERVTSEILEIGENGGIDE